MKKIICLFISLTLLLLSSCGEPKYPPVESTDAEAEVLFTLGIKDKTYEVKYELYRAFFLTYKSEVDGGDSSVWTSDKKDEYVSKMNGLIIPKIADIYSTLYLCEETGFDLYSKKVEDKIEEYIVQSIEGGDTDGMVIEGYGTYENYLAELRKLNHNYQTQLILYRYAIAQDVINEYYIGTLTEDNISENATEGAIKYTEGDVREFYDSDDCVRVLRAYVQERLGEARAEAIRSKMLEANGEEAVAAAIIGNTLTAASDVINGVIISPHNLEAAHYTEMTNAALNLSDGEVSEVIYVRTGYENGYFILYKASKSDEHFEECYDDIVSAYLDNRIGELLSDVKGDMLKSVEYTDAYTELIHADISMD